MNNSFYKETFFKKEKLQNEKDATRRVDLAHPVITFFFLQTKMVIY